MQPIDKSDIQDSEDYREAMQTVRQQIASLLLEEDALVEEIQSQDDLDEEMMEGETVTLEVDKMAIFQALDVLEASINGPGAPLQKYSTLLTMELLTAEVPDLMDDIIEATLEEGEPEGQMGIITLEEAQEMGLIPSMDEDDSDDDPLDGRGVY